MCKQLGVEAQQQQDKLPYAWHCLSPRSQHPPLAGSAFSAARASFIRTSLCSSFLAAPANSSRLLRLSPAALCQSGRGRRWR